ncbi:MAG: glycoside hydrolase family 97 catalytic domain-containing protein [Verrucomicrobiaceae bacterium]
MIRTLLAAFFLVGVVSAATVVKSPDGSVEVGLELKAGVPHWSAKADGVEFLKPGAIEILVGNKGERKVKFEAGAIAVAMHDTTWKPTWGQFSEVRNLYREAVWTLNAAGMANMTLVVRVYDDGIAVRYLMGDRGAKVGDRVGLNFAGDYTFWSANKERPNHGPVKLSGWDAKKGIQAPMTVETGKGLWLGVLEAGIYHQYPFSLKRVEGTRYETRAGQRAWGDEVKSAWRVITIGRSPGELMTNQVIWNLNPESEIKDTSWIKPGYTLWDWRSWGATAPDGFMYGLDMASWRRFIDFAAKHDNVRYLMLDANWYGPEFDPKNDPKKSRDHILEQLEDGHIVRKDPPKDWKDPIDVPGIIKYGKERGVGIILYINDKARINYDFEETLATYEKWGAAGIKYGFMAGGGDDKVRRTREIVELCAKYHLICDFHDGPIPGSGDERTWPNYMTREFCHAQADAKRSFTPGHFVTTIFNNGLTGSLDMANGFYAIKGIEKVRPRVFQKIESTVVAETARTLISYASLAILPDIPEAYEAKADLFHFIETMPMTWDESRVLNAKIGKEVTMARRSGDRWWIGSTTNEEAREITIDFSFLPEGSEWKATIYEDTAETNYQTNPEAYSVRKATVKAGEKMVVKLAAGGGHCVMLEK